jgi:ribosomal protein S18 acetylase RimI-like enzyme
MTVTVRRATAADAALVSALNVDVQALHAAAMPWRFKPPGPSTFPPSEAAALIARPGNVVFLAEVGDEPVGYAYGEVIRRPETAFHYAHSSIYLHHISVRPQHRRRQVGAALIAAVRAAGEEFGVDMMTADVWSFNADARAFFRRHGLTPYIERLWDRSSPAD